MTVINGYGDACCKGLLMELSRRSGGRGAIVGRGEEEFGNDGQGRPGVDGIDELPLDFECGKSVVRVGLMVDCQAY